MEKDIKDESNIEIKKTFSNLMKEELPEMSQEEAIMKYEDPDIIVKKKKSDDNDDETTEEEEHLNRVKKELIESLERVKQLAKKLFNDEAKNKLDLKVKSNKQNGKQRKVGSQESEMEVQKEDKIREREK